MCSDPISPVHKIHLSDEQLSFPICRDVQALDAVIAPGKDSLDGLVILDCFWQHPDPLNFLTQLQICLKQGASAVFIEPLMSPVSYLCAKITHPNQVDIKTSPYQEGGKSSGTNIAFPSMLFDRIENRIEFMKRYPDLTFTTRERMDLFMGRSRFPRKWIPSLFKLDKFLLPILGNFSSFHMKVSVTKKATLPKQQD